jgi:serine/threonine-protein kinase
MPVAIGDVINGKYVIESFLGEGGVGVVAGARNIELDERVALKFLRPEMLAQPEIIARFMREAKAACSIKSEYVANVYDVGTQPDGSPFLVMEFLEGSDLGSVVEERGIFDVREAAEYVMQTCEALAVAHAKGIVHRDIKPENLFLTSRAGMSVVKVLDFGISKANLTGSIFGSALPVVKTVNLMGTPLYMSPEQIRSADGGDMRSDIWALGMVLYELLTGALPISAPTITELCAAILEAPMVSITQHRSDLPPAFVEQLERCIEREPARRFQNVAEMARAFMPFAPKRARICAERAAQALRAADLIEESSSRFLSTVPPAAPSDGNPAVTQPSGLRLPPISSPDVLAAAAASASLPALVPEPTPPPSRTKLLVALVAFAVLAASAAVIATQLRSRPAPVPSLVVAAPETASKVPVEPGTSTATVPAATEARTREGSGPGSASALSAPVAPRRGAPWAPPPKPFGKVQGAAAPAQGPAPPAPPATPKKSADEPDLGY